MARKEFVYHKLKLLTQTDFEDQLDKHLYLRVCSHMKSCMISCRASVVR